MKLPLIKNNLSLKLLVIFTISGLLYSCHKNDPWPPKATDESADVVIGWYKFIAKIQLRASPQPVVILNNRNFGYIGVGLYEAVRPGIKKGVSFSSKLYQMPEMPATQAGQEYLWSASANAALASMFKQFLAGLSNADKVSIDSMENANNTRFRMNTSDAVLLHSQAFGRAIANAIYNWSTSDNFNLGSVGYVPPVFDGAWVPTPPAFAAPVGPFLKNSRPFLEYSLTATAPPLPFAYSTEPTSEFYKAAKEVYDVGKALTPWEKATADWWGDVGGSGVGVPAPYHNLTIINWVLENQKAKLAQAAEIYAKTGIAMKDGPITVFRAKFQYNLIRPVTYIQNHIEKTWQAHLVTPPYPEYPSGLAGICTPVFQVLRRAFGDIKVTDDAYAWRSSGPRYYNSLTQMMDEAAMSRVYGGIHYRFTQYITLGMGMELGDKIADINLIAASKY